MSIKLIEVDWDDPSSLKFAIQKLNNRRNKVLQKLGYTNTNFNGSNYNFNKLMPVMESFINKIPKESGSYYVYAHTNPLKPLIARDNLKDAWLALMCPAIKYRPFYIGKGINKRVYDLNRNDSHRKVRQSIKDKGLDIEPVILFNYLSENTALRMEEALIDVLGLISLSPKHGYLVNLDEGRNVLYRRYGYTEDMLKLVAKNGFKTRV